MKQLLFTDPSCCSELAGLTCALLQNYLETSYINEYSHDVSMMTTQLMVPQNCPGGLTAFQQGMPLVILPGLDAKKHE